MNPQRNKLGNGNIARSERDLTKVTKVRVRPNSMTKDDVGTSNNVTSSASNVALKQRPKMKTTTMIINDALLPANHAAGEKQHRPMSFPTQLGSSFLVLQAFVRNITLPIGYLENASLIAYKNQFFRCGP